MILCVWGYVEMLGLHAEIPVCVSTKIKKDLKMANNNNKQTIWEPLFSSLALIITFQQLLTVDQLVV